jgi:hypothetical protein
METFLYVGVALFALDAVFILVNGLMVAFRFSRYLEQKYPMQYHKLAFENYIKKALRVPWDKNSMQYFVWFSPDDFGDPRIALFKTKLKWSFYGFLLNGIALMIFFAAVAFFLGGS